MSIFNKSKEKTIKTYKPTHKKKNTYVVQLANVLVNFDAFSECKRTPIHVTLLNGQLTQNKSDWLLCKEFPNPCAIKMIKEFEHFRPIMGDKLASTVVEYLDKYTNEPVLSLFPQNQVYFHKTNTSAIMKITIDQDNICMWLPQEVEKEPMRLNHASRQDFFRQVMLRQEKMLTK